MINYKQLYYFESTIFFVVVHFVIHELALDSLITLTELIVINFYIDLKALQLKAIIHYIIYSINQNI